MTSGHLLAKLKKLHRIHHMPQGHGYDQFEEQHYHKPTCNHPNSNRHDGHGTGHSQISTQINIGKGQNYGESSYNNNGHQSVASSGHNSFPSSHVKNQEVSQHAYSGGSDAIVFQDEAKNQNHGFSSFQGSHVTHEDNYQYTNSKYPTNYGYNTKYDSLNLNQHRPTPDEHNKKKFGMGIEIGKWICELFANHVQI